MPSYRIDERPIKGRELSLAAQVGKRAFFDDPFFSFLFPSEKMRARSLPIFFRTVFAHMGAKGRTVTVRNERNEIVGIAAWQTTGGYPLPIGVQLTQMPGSFRAMFPRSKSFSDGFKYMAALTNAHTKDAQWYLMVLCCDPTDQRSGVGTMLLEHAFADVDTEGVGSYLETPRQDNVAYYRRFGYQLVETIRPIEGAPPYYTMWRPPR
jgi:ribosomal protein S18 acetylase RimI-like enzyme